MTFKTFSLKFFVIFFVFTSFNALAQPLSPISPRNGYVINNDSILLKWNKLPSALFYELKYTTDSSFSNNITSVNVGLQTTYWLTPLLSNTTYYWRVEGSNGANTFIGQARKFTNFKPTDLSGCALWLRADTGVTLNGSTVQEWKDLSPNTFNLIQATASAQPTFVSNALNNFPSLSFDGNDIFVLNNFPYGITVNGFLVGKKTNSIVNHGTFTSGNYFDFEMQTLKCETSLNSGVIGSYNAIEWSQLTLLRKSGSSLVNFNGVQSGSINTTTLSPISPGGFAIGNRNPAVNSPSPLRGSISELIINTNSLSNSDIKLVQNYLMDKYTQELSVGSDTLVADNFCPITISATPGFTTYLWSTGESSSSISIDKAGVYAVQAIDVFERVQIDSIIVTYPNFNQLNMSILCAGNQINWNVNLSSPYTFVWQDNSTSNNYNINQPGAYFVKVTDTYGCTFYSDTVAISLDNFPNIAFIGNDTTLCSGNTIQLQNGAAAAINYLWSDGTVNDSLIIGGAGTYWLEVSNNNNCIARDTINVGLTGIAPIANFSNTDICIGLPMPFNDLTIVAPGDSIINWEWTFGDGNLSIAQNPVNLYLQPNNYLVTLKSISQTGCAGIINKIVNVYPHPTLNFIALNNCNEKATTFYDLSNSYGGTITNWDWNFNDNQSTNNSDTGISVSHIFSQVGSYNVELILSTLEGCVDSLLKPVIVKPSPLAAIGHSKLCVGDNVLFQDLSYIPFPHQNIFRQWIFNDTIVSNDFQPTLNYSIDGTYPVELIILASNGCRDTLSVQITVSNYPIVNFNFSSACLGQDVVFTDSSLCVNCSINDWHWTINGSDISDTNILTAPFYQVGDYAIGLEVQNEAGCSSISEQNISIEPLPQAVFSINSNFGSPPFDASFTNLSNNATNYLWNFGDGGTSEFFEPLHQYQDTGVFTISLTALDQNSCSNETSLNLKILPKRIDLALIDAQIQQINDYLYTDLTFVNLSTISIRSFDFNIQSHEIQNNLIENWEGLSLPGEIISYRLSSALYHKETSASADYICYEITNIDAGVDENLNNNKLCDVFDFNEFKIANLYPNPANENLFYTIIAPLSQEVSIEIIDNKGSVVSKNTVQIKKGFNSLSLETMQLTDGVYILKVNFNGKPYHKKFSVFNH